MALASRSIRKISSFDACAETRNVKPCPGTAAARSLKARSAGRGTLALRRLLALSREYPRAAFLQAVTLAEQYGLFDLDRLERLTLRFVAQAYFVVPGDGEEPPS